MQNKTGRRTRPRFGFGHCGDRGGTIRTGGARGGDFVKKKGEKNAPTVEDRTDAPATRFETVVVRFVG